MQISNLSLMTGYDSETGINRETWHKQRENSIIILKCKMQKLDRAWECVEVIKTQHKQAFYSMEQQCSETVE